MRRLLLIACLLVVSTGMLIPHVALAHGQELFAKVTTLEEPKGGVVRARVEVFAGSEMRAAFRVDNAYVAAYPEGEQPGTFFHFPVVKHGLFEGSIRYGRGTWQVQVFVELDDGEIQQGVIPVNAEAPTLLSFGQQLPKFEKGAPAPEDRGSWVIWTAGGTLAVVAVSVFMLWRRKRARQS